MRIYVTNPGEVVKESFWLAWLACGGTFGMGAFRDNPEATKEQVWDNVVGAGDYAYSSNRPDDVHADYVFGRMMKVGLKWGKDFVECRDTLPRGDYQGWCHKYPTYEDLVRAAIAIVEPLHTERT